MDSLSFKNALAEAKPQVEALLDLGLSGDEAFEIASSFEIAPRSIIQHFGIPDLALDELYSKYDISRVEVGMLRFIECPEEVSTGWIIGQVEADYLMLDRMSGEILVRDVTTPGHVIWRCAEDGKNFLAAVAVAAKYLAACISADQAGSSFQREALRDCETLAGGGAYTPFYKMLLGFL